MVIIQILKEITAIESIYPNEYMLGTWLQAYLKKLQFEAEIQKVGKDRFNVLASKGMGKSLLLYGHMDTVPLTGQWKTDPFVLAKRGDRLHGLGVWDMKGGIAAILDAVSNFEPKGYCLKLAFVVDEEFFSLGMYTLIQSGWLSDVYGAISPEPGFTYGLRGIAMGRIGRSVYTVTIKTAGGHVYLLDKSANAINEALKFIEGLRQLKKIKHTKLGEFAIFPRFMTGGVQAMSIPSEVTLELETQLVPSQTSEGVLQDLHNLVRSLKLNAEVAIEPVKRPTPFCEAFEIDRKNPFVTRVKNVLGETIHQKPVYYYRRSVADENRIAALGIPVLTIGPDGGGAHEANEWVSENSLLNLSRFFKELLITYNEKGI